MKRYYTMLGDYLPHINAHEISGLHPDSQTMSQNKNYLTIEQNNPDNNK